ncbi:hypothetical protein N7520_000517 [Penicillium odoratum]|uniref:uncharacterized protein n=1 Tax=Penicillium odoratum TaxID=1167516 RepID=UPI00254699AC|nr:uncharacterized protein N7520_000517 [Penicillium odoratum]KAJ5777271.1 hypothetical protein N7520_000517 [Penicillium odoratum]
MALEDTAVGMPTLDVLEKGPPVRIVLHIQPDLQRNSEINLRTKRLKIVDSFFEWTKPHALNREYTYVHFSTEHELQSWILIDACTGAIPEGSVPDSIPILLYIVSKEKDGLVFKKARSSPFILEYIRSNTDKVPWKAEKFLELPIDRSAVKESNPNAASQVPRWKNHQTWSSASHIFESGIEAKLRQNISCTDPEEIAIQPDPTTPLSSPVSHISLLNIPIRSQDRPIRVLLQISNDDPLGDLREQCTVASRAFLKCMMGDEYQKTKTTYLIRAMNLFVKSAMETWILADYWVGLSKGTGKPPLLTMTYRGEVLDGRM